MLIIYETDNIGVAVKKGISSMDLLNRLEVIETDQWSCHNLKFKRR